MPGRSRAVRSNSDLRGWVKGSGAAFAGDAGSAGGLVGYAADLALGLGRMMRHLAILAQLGDDNHNRSRRYCWRWKQDGAEQLPDIEPIWKACQWWHAHRARVVFSVLCRPNSTGSSRRAGARHD